MRNNYKRMKGGMDVEKKERRREKGEKGREKKSRVSVEMIQNQKHSARKI